MDLRKAMTAVEVENGEYFAHAPYRRILDLACCDWRAANDFLILLLLLNPVALANCGECNYFYFFIV